MPEFLETRVDKFIFKVAADRLYTVGGAWALVRENRVRVGLSDFAQQRSGDVAFARVSPVGTALKAGDEAAEVETIKVNLSLNTPLSGTIVRVNPLMDTAPESINLDPYGEGWMYEIEPTAWDTESADLLTAPVYLELIKHEAESEARHDG